MSKKPSSQLFEKEYFSSAAYADYQKDVADYAGTIGRKIYQYIKDRKQSKILDVGCAQGYFIAYLRAKYSFDVYGLEFSKYAIKEADKSVRSKIKQGNILKSDNFKADSFDLVFCQDVCEYLDKDEISRAVSNLVKWSRAYIFFGDIYKHSSKASQKLNPDPLRRTSLTQKEYVGLFKKKGARYISKFNGGSGGDIMIFKK